MAGKIKDLLDKVILNQSRINPLLADIFKTKLMLRGVKLENYTQDSPDDDAILKKINQLLKDLNINITEEIELANIAVSENEDVELAIEEIKQQLGDKKYKMILYFASSSYNQEQISKVMKQKFKDILCIGCSSVGEFAKGRLYSKAVVATGIPESSLRGVSSYVIDNINENYDVTKAIEHFKNHFNLESGDFEYEKYVGLLIMDGLSPSQDKIISEISKHTDIMFIGGASADNWEMKQTYQYHEYKTYTNSAILILLEPRSYKVIKTQSFVPVGDTFVATKVDRSSKKVLEFNNELAANFYSKLISVPIEELDDNFGDNNIGIMIGDEPYIHDPRCVNFDDLSISFYSEIHEGTEVQLLKPSNMINETKRAINEHIKNPLEVTALINFNCACRTKRLVNGNLANEHEEIFKSFPMIGFSTYGEYYVSLINQTSTILILK